MNRIRFLAGILALFGLDACQRRSPRSPGNGMMGGMMSSMMSSRRGSSELGQMMGSVDQADMDVYMQMFRHHREIRRRVYQLKNGLRTLTESTNPQITALLQAHVSKMYQHVEQGREVRCMSDSLPTMFRHASAYRRRLTLTQRGVAVEETSDDPAVLAAIRRHADEVSGFVSEGMTAMMRGMMP